MLTLEEDDAFALVKCGPRSMQARGFDVHHHEEQPQRWPETPPIAPSASGPPVGGSTSRVQDRPAAPPPDVLVIEVDSLSTASAHRHMPQVMQLLATHPWLQRNVIDVELSLHSVAGRNSIPNQAAFLAGCTAVDGNMTAAPEHEAHEVVAQALGGWRLWCPKGDRTEPARARVPWLFSLAKELGYTTFFGEEICPHGASRRLTALCPAKCQPFPAMPDLACRA